MAGDEATTTRRRRAQPPAALRDEVGQACVAWPGYVRQQAFHRDSQQGSAWADRRAASRH
eukprot:15452065-Alexandrium_andersonii.AAC.1